MPRRHRVHGEPDDFGVDPRLCPAGDSAILVRLGDRIAPQINARVLALLAALDAAAPAGLVECVPAYASLLVTFDPLLTSRSQVSEAILAAWRARRIHHPPPRRLMHVPVQYGGAAGSDLAEVARLTGLSVEEVIRRHAGAEYQVYFLGFLAGYPYLGGLPPALDVPRLDVPRTSVPAGSVAIAEGQTGIYPVSSPGGWRLIGRTDLTVFDAHRDPPALFAPGDWVRFTPVEDATGDATGDATSECPSEDTRSVADSPHPMPPGVGAIPWLRVEQAGPLTTVQDLGRPRKARFGVSPGGAADPDALRRGNLLVGNRPDNAALEITLGGATFTMLASCLIVLTGASCAAVLNGHRLPPETPIWVTEGSELALERASAGLRIYLCTAGGVAVPEVLGSRSTDLRGGFSGLDGRPLRDGDIIWRTGTGESPNVAPHRTVPPSARSALPPAGGRWSLQVTPGPDMEATPVGIAALLERELIVESRSDRMGIRLRTEDGSPLAGGGQALSAGVPRGAIQLPPGGEPVILGADGQTTGGYRVPLVVATADWWQVGQLRPGDHVRLQLISEAEAVVTLRQRLQILSRVAPVGPTLDLALLMRGFAEW
ncbi:MAG TPA: 5-oxoprolinase subunit PxpB, partial [Ktedonobacterales bacterium]|nr:5-oxoprolinase subunit PxpB [Ktedonobacterales bacterium]